MRIYTIIQYCSKVMDFSYTIRAELGKFAPICKDIIKTSTNIDFQNAESRCTFCLIANRPDPVPESFEHIFFSCPTTQNILKKFFEKFLIPILSAETYFTGSGVDGNEKENVPFSLTLDILRYYIWQCKLNKKLPIFSCITEDVSYTINMTRKTNMEISDLFEHCTMFTRRDEPDGDRGRDADGAAERVQAGRRAGDACNDIDCDGDGSSSDEEKTTDSARLLESGAVLHAMSGDEGEGDGSDEEIDARDLTQEEAAAATAVLDAPDDDQEGLALTGSDWFNTIKQAVKNNKEAEKELAAGMKKAKISQTSLENEVFEGEPSIQSSADESPGLLQKDSPPMMLPPPPPPASSPNPPLRPSKKLVPEREKN